MQPLSRDRFLEELETRRRVVDAFIARPRYRDWFGPEHLREAAYSYIDRPGKRLRPAILLFACGAAGGNEDVAVPAAAAVELFHTWTLVHDDLIDDDHLRRGRPTVHVEAAARARDEWSYTPDQARDYGRDVCILTGDVQQGWSVSMFLECASDESLDPRVVIALLHRMESCVLPELIRGELLDVQFSRRPFDQLSVDDILTMLELKTGVLLEFAALAGACLGANALPENCPTAQAVAEFARKCGVAFQLQDDILGIVGDEAKLGKPVGSDLREGKRTTIVLHALAKTNAEQRKLLEAVLGNRDASADDVSRAAQLLVELGGVSQAKELAEVRLQDALSALDTLPDSHYKACLLAWADFMIDREF